MITVVFTFLGKIMYEGNKKAARIGKLSTKVNTLLIYSNH